MWITISWCNRHWERQVFDTNEDARRWVCSCCRHWHYVFFKE